MVPVAGLGTRLLPATRSQPKEMLPVLDKPVVQYVVEELAAAGIERVLFVTGRRKRAIEDHFDVDPELPSLPPGEGVEILYTRQPRPAGLGDAVARGHGFAGDAPVVVAVGDSIIEPGPGDSPGSLVRRLVEAYFSADACAAIAVAAVPDALVSRYGIVVPEAKVIAMRAQSPAFLASTVLEKPDPSETQSRWAVMGRYVLGPSVLQALRHTPADASGEVQLADALRAAIGAGERVVAVPLTAGERRHDIGTAAGYASVFVRYALRDPRFGEELRGQAAVLIADAGG
ncbi:MAG TPA: sugar phosphate nucleotidyltransferase [Solirubrobacteraceae bacterium]|nr:sugar phosphate nucleotidyltransferase [Solirubrobacteraceae bacterium]